MRIQLMSPTQAAILACATIGAVSLIPATDAFSVNFVYNDLLAHPQYDVQFLKDVIPASSVSSHPNKHRRQPTQRQAQIETAKTEGQDWEQETIHESPSTMVMTDTDGMRWSCLIPPKLAHEVKAAPTLTPQEIKDEERRSIRRGLELLDHLSGSCLLMTHDYWTYEYCHKQSIRQYHAVQSNNQWVPESEDNTYLLAHYQSGTTNVQDQPASNEAALQQRSSSSASSAITTTELEVSNDRKYLVQHWGHGDLCKVTGVPRTVEVQFQCAPVKERIHMATEPSSCNYIMVIISPNLCMDTAFKSVPAPEANRIQCRRIVSDEQYQKLKAASVHQEAIDGSDLDAGIAQDNIAQIKIGQVPRQQATHDHKQQQAGAADPQANVMSDFEKVLEHASQKTMKEHMALYKAISEVIKAIMPPEHRAMYEKMEDIIQRMDGGDKQAMLSADEQEDIAKFMSVIEELLGSEDGTEKRSKFVEPAYEATEQQPKQRKFDIHTQNSGAQLTKDQEDPYKRVVEAATESDNKKKEQQQQAV